MSVGKKTPRPRLVFKQKSFKIRERTLYKDKPPRDTVWFGTLQCASSRLPIFLLLCYLYKIVHQLHFGFSAGLFGFFFRPFFCSRAINPLKWPGWSTCERSPSPRAHLTSLGLIGAIVNLQPKFPFFPPHLVVVGLSLVASPQLFKREGLLLTHSPCPLPFCSCFLATFPSFSSTFLQVFDERQDGQVRLAAPQEEVQDWVDSHSGPHADMCFIPSIMCEIYPDICTSKACTFPKSLTKLADS